MIDINFNPSPREQRQFAGIWLPAFFVLVGGLVYWRTHWSTLAVTIWATGGVLTTLALIITPLRRPLYVGWMCAAYPIGWTVSHLILVVVYYLVITPIGLFMRLCGHDPLQRRLDRHKTSYWIKRPAPPASKTYFRQH